MLAHLYKQAHFCVIVYYSDKNSLSQFKHLSILVFPNIFDILIYTVLRVCFSIVYDLAH